MQWPRKRRDLLELAVVLNQLATPGLGSWIAGHRIAGAGQLLVGLVAFADFLFQFALLIAGLIQVALGDLDNPTFPTDSLKRALLVLAIAWCWALITSFQLLHERRRLPPDLPASPAPGPTPAQAHPLAPKPNPARIPPMQTLDSTQIHSALATVPGWTLTGNTIVRAFEFPDFPEAIRFVNRLADEAENAGHHPDIDIRWNRVRLSLTTHDAGGLTSKDFDLARRLDALASETLG